jgi:WS/DGAT/MGAT family acyltransferase
MTAADTAWLHMDRPTNLMVINSVLLFDEPVDWERLKHVAQQRLVECFPRFRQRVVESHVPLRAPRWEDDPDYSLEHHMHHLALPAPGDRAALQELLGDMMTMPLDRNRPLWHVYMVDGFGTGAAIITRMHHCIADGISLARLMLSLTDSRPDAGTAPPLRDGRDAHSHRHLSAPAGSSERALDAAAHVAAAAVKHGANIVASPSHAAILAGAVARDGATALRLLLTPADAASAIKGDPGISRRVAWAEPIRLADVKRTAHAHDATVNDVLMAALAGALRHYLLDRGSPVGEIQAMVPFNLRPLDEPIPRELGNKFGLVFLPLPVGVSGSLRRLIEVHKRMGEIKRSREGPVSYGLLSATGLTPAPVERRIVDLFTGKGTAIVTNVPGPSRPMYMAGVPVRAVLIWAPTSGHIGMSVSMFSYRGDVTIGLMVDATLIPDPGEVVTELKRELTTLAGLRPINPRRPRAVRSAFRGD